VSDELRLFFGRGPGRARIHLSALAIALAMLTCVPAQAFDSYENGHITRVSYYSDLVLISVDSGCRPTVPRHPQVGSQSLLRTKPCRLS